MAVGKCGSNCSTSSSRYGSNRSISSRRETATVLAAATTASSFLSSCIDQMWDRGGHLIVVLTLLGSTKRNRHPRPVLQWAACTSASGAEDSRIWPRSVPLHSGSKVHAITVVSMTTATTTVSPTSTTHTPMLTSLAI